MADYILHTTPAYMNLNPRFSSRVELILLVFSPDPNKSITFTPREVGLNKETALDTLFSILPLVPSFDATAFQFDLQLSPEHKFGPLISQLVEFEFTQRPLSGTVVSAQPDAISSPSSITIPTQLPEVSLDD